MDQPSATMWWTLSSSTCDCSPSFRSMARSSGPAARSKGLRDSALMRRRASASRCSGGRPLRSMRAISSGAGALMRCTGPSDSPWNVVRRDSWRCTRASRARRIASASRVPASSRVNGMLKAALPGSSWSRNHTRCCEYDRGSFCARDTRSMGGSVPASPALTEASMRAASAATVGARNSSRSGSSTPKDARMRETTRVASSEWPPTSKKLSSAPTRGRPSTSAQSVASFSSVGVRGAT